MGYDLGIDVRGDVLTVVVLALAGVRRRVGWSMGGGAFLLTDVAGWIPGRHEVRSRLALLSRLGISPDESARVDVHVRDEERVVIARRLAEAWPRRTPGARRTEVQVHARAGRGRLPDDRDVRPSSLTSGRVADEADWLHADRLLAAAPTPGRPPRGG